MRRKIVSLRGRPQGTEMMTIDVLLSSDHALGWKGWLIEDRLHPIKNGVPLLWLSIDWVEYAVMEFGEYSDQD